MFFTELRLAISAVLEAALNRYLQLDEEAQQKLLTMQGKCLAVEILELDITLYLLVDAHGIQVFNHYPDTPDATLRGTPMALLGLALETKPGPATFANGVTITGDTELGQQFKRLFDSLDIDWEEQLSRYTGDIAAHKLSDLLRNSAGWGKQASQTLQQDMAEYLLQEAHLVAEKAELEQFFNDIDTLRDDMDRLQARIQRLISSATHAD